MSWNCLAVRWATASSGFSACRSSSCTKKSSCSSCGMGRGTGSPTLLGGANSGFADTVMGSQSSFGNLARAQYSSTRVVVLPHRRLTKKICRPLLNAFGARLARVRRPPPSYRILLRCLSPRTHSTNTERRSPCSAARLRAGTRQTVAHPCPT